MTQVSAVLVLLDLTVAFDTVNHTILLSRLKQCVSIKGTAQKWIHSYLTDKSFYVYLGEFSSSAAPLSCGIPQGSILGPMLFCCKSQFINKTEILFTILHTITHPRFAIYILISVSLLYVRR